MPPVHEVRGASKKAGAASPPKKYSSASSPSTKSQVSPGSAVSPDCRRKCELCTATAGIRSRKATSPMRLTCTKELSRTDLAGGGSGEDTDRHNSSHCRNDEDGSISDSTEKLNVALERFTETNYKPAEEEVKTLEKEHLESLIVAPTGLGGIQPTTQRLRAGPILKERPSEQNEKLERQLAEQKASNEGLQQELLTLREAEQENIAYLQVVKLLEQRNRELEEACTAKTMELNSISEKLRCLKLERDQLHHEVQNAKQNHHEHAKALKSKQRRLLQRIEQLECSQGTQSDDQKRMECQWKQKVKDAEREHTQTVVALQRQLEQSHSKTNQLESEVQELEKQIKNLLATTLRQTTVIEECDRVLSETKEQQQQTQFKYEEELKLSCELRAKSQRLEVQVESLKESAGTEAIALEKKLTSLENKLIKYESALREKDKKIDVMNRAYVAQEDLGEMNKEFQRKERKLKCDVSELQIALRDAKHENSLLTEQVLEMQEQMKSERKDRTRWATARLKLLAEFCDEESYQRSVTEDMPLISSPPRRKAKGRRTPRNNMMDDESYDGDDSDKEARQRRNSIVFG